MTFDLDFAASFPALTRNGLSRYRPLELYHPVGSWKSVLTASYRHQAPLTGARK